MERPVLTHKPLLQGHLDVQLSLGDVQVLAVVGQLGVVLPGALLHVAPS